MRGAETAKLASSKARVAIIRDASVSVQLQRRGSEARLGLQWKQARSTLVQPESLLLQLQCAESAGDGTCVELPDWFESEVD